MRRTFPCRYCGYGYKGRGIYADHGLAEYNLAQHESVCLDRQKKRAEKAVKQYWRRFRRAALQGDPLPGQLGFPFAGVPVEVK